MKIFSQDTVRELITYKLSSLKSSLFTKYDLFYQLLGLHEKHDYHAILIYAKKGKKTMVFDSYTTPGFAEEFIGVKGGRTESGDLIMNAVQTSFSG